MFCYNCGKEIKEGSSFCKYCGANLRENIADNNAGIVNDGMGAVSSSADTGAENGQTDLRNLKETAGTRLGKPWVIPVLAGSAAVLLVGIIIGGVFLLRENSDKTEGVRSEAAEEEEKRELHPENDEKEEKDSASDKADDTEDDEDIVEEAEIPKELNVEENENLLALMQSMTWAAWWNSEYSSVYRDLGDGMQKWSDNLYRGDWEYIGDLVSTIAIYQDMPYIDEIRRDALVADWLSYLDSSYMLGAMLTKEQSEYLAESALGTEWEMQSIDEMIYSDAAYGSEVELYDEFGGYIRFIVEMLGDPPWVELHNITADYVGNDTWEVTADCCYTVIWHPAVQVADITFSVTENPDSCFDGYSITGMNVTSVDNSGWAQAYYDYLSDYKDTFAYAGEVYLIHVDDDGIPEMYIVGSSYASGDLFVYYHQGQAKDQAFTNMSGTYIEGSGLIKDSGGHMGYYYDIIYQLTDGILQTVADGEWDEEYDADSDSWTDSYSIDEKEVSEEEYETRLNEIFDPDESRAYSGSDSVINDFDSVSAFLQRIISG